MDISVVIPTFNRAASLDRLLDDCRHQDAIDLAFEVIVADNGSTDDTRAVVERHARMDSRVRYVSERQPGASCARNAGIAAAAAPLLAFIDDDVRPSTTWLCAIHRTFSEHPEIDCIGGRIEGRWPAPPPSWLTPAHWGPLALQIRRSPHVDRDHASACLVTANVACRASVFRELGGFSPEFRRDEDREFNLRMWRAGKRGMYADHVVAYAEIQPERLGKSYHRRWHHVTGSSHARLRYREIITPDGRLDETLTTQARRVAGVPGFLYREWLQHAGRWMALVLCRQHDAAFFHECRLRYLTSYVMTRWRDRLHDLRRSFLSWWRERLATSRQTAPLHSNKRTAEKS